jgi:CRISPR-associated protein (TIGR02710 family)
MDEIANLVEKWISLVRTDIEEAEDFYWKNIFPLVEKKFLDSQKLDEKYDWLILPCGLEASYYILLIKALKPKKVYFIGTREFKEYFLNRIIERTGLKPSDYIVDTLDYDEMDVADVYDKIRRHLDLFYNKKVVLDLTRGKRIMSVGAGIVGAFFGFDLVYIDEGWIDEIKRGRPGTEKLVTAKNPFDVFGDLEGQEARELFNYYNYGAAMYFYKRLREKVADPRKIEIEELLAEAYLHWNSFNFKAALMKMNALVKRSEQYGVRINPHVHENLVALKILDSADPDSPESLDDEFNLHIIIDLYANALRKAETGMFEDAICRLYRVLELVSQARLRSYSINTIGQDLSRFEQPYKAITKEIYGFEKLLPLEIGLKDGYILLFILKDYVVDGETLEDLKNMFGVIRIRDTSIIAHGLKLAGEKPFRNMDALAKKFIERICKKQEQDMNKLLKQHTFIKL